MVADRAKDRVVEEARRLLRRENPGFSESSYELVTEVFPSMRSSASPGSSRIEVTSLTGRGWPDGSVGPGAVCITARADQ